MARAEVQAFRRSSALAVPAPGAYDWLGGADLKRPLNRGLVLDRSAEVQNDRHPHTVGLAVSFNDPRRERISRRERAKRAGPRHRVPRGSRGGCGDGVVMSRRSAPRCCAIPSAAALSLPTTGSPSVRTITLLILPPATLTVIPRFGALSTPLQAGVIDNRTPCTAPFRVEPPKQPTASKPNVAQSTAVATARPRGPDEVALGVAARRNFERPDCSKQLTPACFHPSLPL